jgi:hypothetical protein
MFKWIILVSLIGIDGYSDPVDYTHEVRPILSENCFYCHGQDATKRKAKLRLDTKEGQRGNEVVIPKDAENSELIARIFSKDEDEHMPPKSSNRQLTEEQKLVLTRWINEGASFTPHWSFTELKRPSIPKTVDSNWIKNPIDSFVLQKLVRSGLVPSNEATKETLIRRLSLDLTGLPPTLNEVDDFVNDESTNAYEHVVDRLMASQHYGEKMALPWLDSARYADSNGYQEDGDTFQWIWRDWVVKAMNANMPFDQFTIEQLAGDLLPNSTQEQKIATAFNRNHLLNGEGGAIPEEQRNVSLFDRVDTTSTTWLGLTMACAQCHDHKYDPIKQKDYYAFMDAFNHLPETGGSNISAGSRIRLAKPVLDLGSPEHKKQIKTLEDKKKENKSDQQISALLAKWIAEVAKNKDFPDKEIYLAATLSESDKTDSQRSALRRYHYKKVLPTQSPELYKDSEELIRLKSDDDPMVMVMEDSKPRDTYILDRGNYESHLGKVNFNTPEFLPPMPSNSPHNRLGLARWIVSPANPLTARVTVNRYWQTFFGLGIVKTSEDFGVQSDPPVHQELLDWLASEFVSSGWNVKHIQRLIVTSATYRQSSLVTPYLLDKDPENRLYARGARFRMPAMLIRDQALATSGLLVDKIGGKPVYPYQPADIWGSLNITKERDFTYPQSKGNDLYRRSIYTFWRRTVAPANMFDASVRNTCKVRSMITSTPLHALVTLNDPTYIEAARRLAQKTLRAKFWKTSRISYAFKAVLSRYPDSEEKEILTQCYNKQLTHFKNNPTSALSILKVGDSSFDTKYPAPEEAAFTAVCLAIFNLDEALTKS